MKTTGKYDNPEFKRESLLNYLESFSQNIKPIKASTRLGGEEYEI